MTQWDGDAIIDALAEALDEVDDLHVIKGGPWHYGSESMPCALINSGPQQLDKIAMSDDYNARLQLEVLLIIRETEPENWLTDVNALLDGAVNAILDDATLGGSVDDIVNVVSTPGSILFPPGNKLYYGGSIRLTVTKMHEHTAA